MGRELRRKQAKKEGRPLKENNKNNKSDNQYDDIYKLLKVFGIILLVILLIYLFVAIVITKEIEIFKKDNENVENTNDKVENQILARNTFLQKDLEYYVYFYDFDDEVGSINVLIDTKLSDEKVYRVNTNDAFNTNYVAEDVGNRNAQKIEDVKVINPTLIKINDGIITSYYENSNEIIEYLENLE